MNKYRQIREKLYDILLAASSEEDSGGNTNVTQNMGIAMTAAVRKGGVVNVISQNVVIQKVCPKVIDLLQFADKLELEDRTIEVQQIEHVKDPIEKCCDHFFEMRADWSTLRDSLKLRYFEYVRSRSRSNEQAGDFLKVSTSMVSKIMRDYEDSRPDV